MDSNFTNETNETVETTTTETVETIETVQGEVVTEPINEAEAPKEQTGLSIASLILGIVGLLAWCIPCLGFVVGITGLILGIIGMKKGGKTMAIVGIVLSGLTLLLSCGNFIAGFIIAMGSM